MKQQHARAIAALKNLFIADALAMPVHWYYEQLVDKESLNVEINALLKPSALLS